MKELARNFPARRAALDQIVALSRQDDLYQFVDRYNSEQFLALDPAGYPYHGQHDEKRLPQSRLNQYFALYRQADVRDGLIRSRAGDVDLIAGVGNDLYGGHTTGYLYCEQAPVPDLSPERRDEACTGNHNDPSRSAKFYRYQKLADHWFAYERGSK